MSSFLFEDVVNTLRENLRHDLPGIIAHQEMAPQKRMPLQYYLENEKNYRVASVLILLFQPENDKSCRVILIERTSGNISHSGQISFPGGKIEDTDEDHKSAALRETFEELGINKSKIEILGELSPVFIPPSKFLVHPFIGITNGIPEFNINSFEVHSVFTPEIAAFHNRDNRLAGKHKTSAELIVHAPYFQIDHRKIWGATAMMIAELLYLLDVK